MSKPNRYVKGEWNVICDYCGMEKKSSEVKLTWDNALVCSDTCWEPRHPQDFVKSKVDKQRVPPHLARPDDRDNFTTTTTNGAVVKGAETVILDDVVAVYTTIGIELDRIVQLDSEVDGDLVDSDVKDVHWTTVKALATKTVTLLDPMPYAAADENVVYIHHDDRFLGTNEVSVDDL